MTKEINTDAELIGRLLTTRPTPAECLVSAARIEQLTEDRDRLREALEVCVASIEHADMSDGVCCCGEEIEGHSDPIHSGHTPVDMGEYHASLAIKKARAALKGESHE